MDLCEVPTTGFVRHPWERARLDFFHGLLRDHVELGAVRRILDVGSGDGWLARQLLARLPAHVSMTCFDVAYERTGLPRSGERLTFTADMPSEPFDLLLFLDVLEHVEDDYTFLPELLQRAARPGAQVLLTVPAWPLLASSHDSKLGHHRRYSPDALLALARHAGLRPLRHGQLFVSLLLPRAASVARERTFGAKPGARPQLHWPFGERSARFFQAALALDAGFCRTTSAMGWRIPGLSTWVLCELG